MVAAHALRQHQRNLESGGVFDKDNKRFSDLDVELKVSGGKVTREHGRDTIPDYGVVEIPQILAWNTNRPYTGNGQRIAACAIDNGVYMVDVDRGLSYFFRKCPLERPEIMRRYDGNIDSYYCPPSLMGSSELGVLRDLLEEAARALKVS